MRKLMPAQRFLSTTAKYVDIPLAAKDGGTGSYASRASPNRRKPILGTSL